MTTHDLLELAVLDAHGMLDEDERRGFERSLNAASESIRRKIHREQARLVDLTGLLPEVIPPESLREQVLEAVRAEIRADEETARAQQTGPQPGQRTLAHAGVDASAPRPRRLRRPARVSALWRAGSLGLSAAAITMAVLMFNLRNEYETLARALDNNAALDLTMRGIGTGDLFDTIFDAQTTRVTFELATDQIGTEGMVPITTVFMNPDWSGFNLYHRLPSDTGGGYELAVLDDDGNVDRVVHAFTSDGSLTITRVNDPSVTASTRLAVFHVSNTGDRRLMLSSHSA